MNRFIFIGLVLTALIGYFIYSQNKIDKLNRTNAEISSSLESHIEANNMLRANITRQIELLEDARSASADAERRAVEALQAFEDSDINYLSQKKPELIQRIINEGTKNVLNQIETITAQ